MSDFYNKYPYTDFHELNLDWVIERVKKLTEDWASTLTEWNNTKEEWQQLYDYVHNYFNNLDVQEEINNKIDVMIANGTFAAIAKPIIEAQTIITTTSWLADHITQPTVPVVDTSLTIAGAAADSKTVGDNFTENNERVSYMMDVLSDSDNKFNKYAIASVIKGARIRTEDNVMISNPKSLVFIVSCTNGQYCANFPELLPSSYDLVSANIGTFSTYPEINDVMTQVGTTNLSYNRGTIIVSSGDPYLAFSITFHLQEDYDTKYQDMIDNLVIYQGSAYATDYIEPLVKISNPKNLIKSSNVSIITSNYTDYFTDYNDVPINSIYRIGSMTDADHLSNEPLGVTQYNHLGDSYGHLAGTLITYSNENDKTAGGETQILISHTNQRGKEVSTISFRNSYTAGGIKIWTEWTQFNPTLLIQASNTVVRAESCVALGLTDLNDFPDNSIYQLDLDCGYDGNGDPILANDPCPGISRVLQTVNFSNTGHFGKYQILVAYGIPTKVFFRYGYQVSGVPYWADWSEMANTSDAKMSRGKLTDNTDLNDLIHNEIYWLRSDCTYSNMPTGVTEGMIDISQMLSSIMQIITTISGVQHVRYSPDKGVNWTNWT